MHDAFNTMLKDAVVRAVRMTEGISHIDDIPVERVVKLVKKLARGSDDIKVTEKVDGVHFKVGVVDGEKLYTSTKKGSRVFDVDVPRAYDTHFLQIFADVHGRLNDEQFASIVREFLTTHDDEVREFVPNFDISDSEVEFEFEFIGPRANVIAYDPNKVGNGALIVLRITIDGVDITDTHLARKLVDAISNRMRGVRVYTLRTFDVKKFAPITIDVMRPFDELADILSAHGGKLPNELRGRAREAVVALKDYLIKNWVDAVDTNMLGGSGIEGLVIHDTSSDDIVKLVDKERFTRLLRKLWTFRNSASAALERFYKRIGLDAANDPIIADLVRKFSSTTFKKRHGIVTPADVAHRAMSLNSTAAARALDELERDIDESWRDAIKVHDALKSTPNIDERVVDDNVSAEYARYKAIKDDIKRWRKLLHNPPEFIKQITPASRWTKKLDVDGRVVEQASTRSLNEGGHAFSDVMPITLKQYERIIPRIIDTLNDIGVRNVVPLGSTGKKRVMNDVDLGGEIEITLDDVKTSLERLFGANAVKKMGSSMLSFKWPLDDGDERRFVQVDLMLGVPKYLQWSYAGTSDVRGCENYSALKGKYRNILLNTLLRVLSNYWFAADKKNSAHERVRYTIDTLRGLYKVRQVHNKAAKTRKWKTIEREFITDDPEEIVKRIFGAGVDPRSVLTFEGLVRAIKTSPATKEHADEVFKEFVNELSVLIQTKPRNFDPDCVSIASDIIMNENKDKNADSRACFVYERKVINALNVAGISGNIKDPAGCDHLPDADFVIDGNNYYLEIKQDKRAQMGGTSIRWNKTTPGKFTFVNEIDPVLKDMIIESLSDKINEIDALVEFISSMPGNDNFVGFPGTVTKDAWRAARNAKLLLPINTSIRHTTEFINQHYNAKGVYYMQIGGAGLFYMGENIANLPVPPLQCEIDIEIRASRSGSKVRKSDGLRVASALLRVQGRLKAKNISSPYTFDDPKSIRKMMRELALLEHFVKFLS